MYSMRNFDDLPLLPLYYKAHETSRNDANYDIFLKCIDNLTGPECDFTLEWVAATSGVKSGRVRDWKNRAKCV